MQRALDQEAPPRRGVGAQRGQAPLEEGQIHGRQVSLEDDAEPVPIDLFLEAVQLRLDRGEPLGQPWHDGVAQRDACDVVDHQDHELHLGSGPRESAVFDPRREDGVLEGESVRRLPGAAEHQPVELEWKFRPVLAVTLLGDGDRAGLALSRRTSISVQTAPSSDECPRAPRGSSLPQ